MRGFEHAVKLGGAGESAIKRDLENRAGGHAQRVCRVAHAGGRDECGGGGLKKPAAFAGDVFGGASGGLYKSRNARGKNLRLVEAGEGFREPGRACGAGASQSGAVSEYSERPAPEIENSALDREKGLFLAGEGVEFGFERGTIGFGCAENERVAVGSFVYGLPLPGIGALEAIGDLRRNREIDEAEGRFRAAGTQCMAILRPQKNDISGFQSFLASVEVVRAGSTHEPENFMIIVRVLSRKAVPAPFGHDQMKARPLAGALRKFQNRGVAHCRRAGEKIKICEFFVNCEHASFPIPQ